MNPETIHVALASDARGSVGLVVAVRSLLLQSSRPFHVWIIEDHIDQASQARMTRIWKRAHPKVEVDFIAQESLPIKPPSWWIGTRWPMVSCARFQLADVLPRDAKRCIYLDIDILVGTDLGALFDLDLQGRPIGMVVNDGMSQVDRDYVKGIGLDPDQYCNAGVLLMDLDAWRSENAGAGLIEQGRSMPPDIWFFDQDMLNAYFKGRCLLLDPRWNKRDAALTPAGYIQHFAGSPKPWNTEAGEVTAVGLKAWHAARADAGFVPVAPSMSARARASLKLGLARIERRIRRTFAA